MSILFAATFPERVQSLALYGTMARFTQELARSIPWGFAPEEQFRPISDEIETHWGEGVFAELFFGDAIAGLFPVSGTMSGALQRASASPTMALMLWHSLVESTWARSSGQFGRRPSSLTRSVAMRSPPSEAAPSDGRGHARMRNSSSCHRAPRAVRRSAGSRVLNFVCEQARRRRNERVLMTVLFTDIVGSTEQ